MPENPRSAVPIRVHSTMNQQLTYRDVRCKAPESNRNCEMTIRRLYMVVLLTTSISGASASETQVRPEVPFKNGGTCLGLR